MLTSPPATTIGLPVTGPSVLVFGFPKLDYLPYHSFPLRLSLCLAYQFSIDWVSALFPIVRAQVTTYPNRVGVRPSNASVPEPET